MHSNQKQTIDSDNHHSNQKQTIDSDNHRLKDNATNTTSVAKQSVGEYLADIKRQGLVTDSEIPELLKNTGYCYTEYCPQPTHSNATSSSTSSSTSTPLKVYGRFVENLKTPLRELERQNKKHNLKTLSITIERCNVPKDSKSAHVIDNEAASEKTFPNVNTESRNNEEPVELRESDDEISREELDADMASQTREMAILAQELIREKQNCSISSNHSTTKHCQCGGDTERVESEDAGMSTSMEKIIEKTNNVVARCKAAKAKRLCSSSNTSIKSAQERRKEINDLMQAISNLINQYRSHVIKPDSFTSQSNLNTENLNSGSNTSLASYYSTYSNNYELFNRCSDEISKLYYNKQEQPESSSTSKEESENSFGGNGKDFCLNVSCRRSCSHSSISTYYSLRSSRSIRNPANKDYANNPKMHAKDLRKSSSDTSISRSSSSHNTENTPNSFIEKLQHFEPFGFLCRLFSSKP